MRRIPDGNNAEGCRDNLIDAPGARLSRRDGEDIIGGVGTTFQQPLGPGGLAETLISALGLVGKIPPNELAEFVQRLLVFFTSCEERRYGQWENTRWLDFVRAEGKSDEYKKILARGLTRSLVAAKEEVASSRTIGNMAEAFVMTILNRGNDGSLDRILDAPTNEAWIDPWVTYLKAQGVQFHVGQEATSLVLDKKGKVSGFRVKNAKGKRRTVEADFFFLATPVERAVKILRGDVLKADPSLAELRELKWDWMNGIQFFMKSPTPITNGHAAYMDAPWALTSISQAQFWKERDLPRDYGDGTVKDIISVDMSDWDTPGLLLGKPGKQCTRDEVINEVWHQLKLHLNDREEILKDDQVHSVFLDPAIQWDPAKRLNSNDEPLLVNTVGSWEKRPTPKTKIPNLFLAGDYVQNDIDLATMEGANESGREAVNQLLESIDSKATRVKKFKLYDPPEFEAAKKADLELWKAGRPNAIDVAPPDVPLPRAMYR
jgi:uncharacterized protein with NAD-binding domain and iron-sulfur cluster